MFPRKNIIVDRETRGKLLTSAGQIRRTHKQEDRKTTKNYK